MRVSGSYAREDAVISYDVLIIGAGAAGLNAAACLARAGCSALLLDARLHIGGRVWSHHEAGLPVPVELGAEFIHGRARSTFKLLANAGTAAVDSGGEHWTLHNGKLERARDLFSEIQHAVARTPALNKEDLAFETFLRRHLDHVLSPDARRFARTLAEGFDAADLKKASARAIVEEWGGGSSVQAPQFRPLGGYGALLSSLSAGLRGSSVVLQLNSTVHTVRWRRGSVEVAGVFLGQPFQVRAARAVLTLPIGVLKHRASAAGSVTFTPPLAAKRPALKHIAAGAALKVSLRFRVAFWEKLNKGRYGDAAFFHVPGAAFPTFWTTLPVRTPLLVAWAAGPKAIRFAGASSERIIGEALKSLTALFGEASRSQHRLEGAWVHDWQSDPYARGAYSYVMVGGDKAREVLAAPLAGTLFFAGEAADISGEAGTVAGALESGKRAAEQVLASLKKR
jgi:monoamine oxidase